MGLQLEVTSGRTLSVRGSKKVIRVIQREHAATHSFTLHITLRADGELPQKMPIVLYEPNGAPQKFPDEVAPFKNLHSYVLNESDVS